MSRTGSAGIVCVSLGIATANATRRRIVCRGGLRRIPCNRGNRVSGHADGARRVADGAVPARPARGRPQGGPAADGHRVRRVGPERQPRRRREAEVVLHLLVRPEAPRRARRGGATAAAGGDRPHGRPVRPPAHDRLGAGEPGLAVPHRPGGGRLAPTRPRGPGDRRRRAPADARVLPAHAREREDRDGDRPDDPVGLPDLPHGAAPLPVLRRQGGVRLLRHQPQLAPAQARGPAVHRA